jgi:hypothetical protein
LCLRSFDKLGVLRSYDCTAGLETHERWLIDECLASPWFVFKTSLLIGRDDPSEWGIVAKAKEPPPLLSQEGRFRGRDHDITTCPVCEGENGP